MSTSICASALVGSLMLVDFQGHVLDLANSVNPVISQTRNPTLTLNQQWGLALVNGGGRVLASGVSQSGPTVVVSFDTAAQTSPLFMQAIGASTTSIAFEVDCVNATAGSLITTANGLALTAWPAGSASTIAPVTFETFTGVPQQVWTFETLE